MQFRGDIPTPALLLDLDAFEDNIRKMASHLKARRKGFRPHGKTHKCPEIARALVRAALAAGDVACVLAEPAMTNIGIVLPEPGFHEALRDKLAAFGDLEVGGVGDSPRRCICWRSTGSHRA